MSVSFKILMLAPALGLGACSDRDGNAQGTDISINAKGDNGSDVAITADGKTGKVAINLPGFDAKFSLPKAMLDSGNFEIDGVKLYPGSKVTSVNVDGDKSGAGDKSVVRIGFTSPTEPAKVQDWFVKAFADESVTVTPGTNGLSGKNEDGDPFTMTFAPAGAGKTNGQIVITDAQ